MVIAPTVNDQIASIIKHWHNVGNDSKEEEESSFYNSNVSTTSHPYEESLIYPLAERSPSLTQDKALQASDQPAGFKRTSQFSSESQIFCELL